MVSESGGKKPSLYKMDADYHDDEILGVSSITVVVQILDDLLKG